MSDAPSFHPRQALVRLGVLLLAVSLVTSCSLKRRVNRFFAGDIKMEVAISSQLNDNTPVPVEVIFFYDDGLFDGVLKQSARDWFANREQFIKDNEGKKTFQSWKWEWVPGQKVEPVELDYRIGVVGGIVFAGYASAGSHRQSFDPQLNIALDLGATDFSLRQGR